jgi:hypothetical protein
MRWGVVEGGLVGASDTLDILCVQFFFFSQPLELKFDETPQDKGVTPGIVISTFPCGVVSRERTRKMKGVMAAYANEQSVNFELRTV